MRPIKAFAIFAFVALTLSSTAAFATRAVEIEDREVPIVSVSDKALTQAAVKKAIMIGAQTHSWQIKKDAPGKIQLHLDYKGREQLTVDVAYDTKKYVIKYVDSELLKYKDHGDGRRTISGHYARWVQNLVTAINAELLRQQ
ncbi:MAG: hypothetical protein HY308_06640 [Gammaproteobacteria bacterium]|nr:hypothetical protein [Gammaproteobacteria bacterium]